MLSPSLRDWASRNNFDKLIDQVRDQLKKSDFIANIEKLMKARGYQEFNYIDYPQITVNTLSKMLNYDDRDGYIKLAALYFVIDVIHLTYLYKNPKIEIIDEFCNIIKLKSLDCQLVSAGWMLENGYPPNNIENILFNNPIPAYFRLYFLQQLIFTNDFTTAYRFYSKFEFPLNDKCSEEGKIIVQCLTANGKINDALNFIRQYCSPEEGVFSNFYQSYIIELYRVANLTHKEPILNSTKFTQKEIDIILGYIACTESEKNIQVNAFYIMHQNSNC